MIRVSQKSFGLWMMAAGIRCFDSVVFGCERSNNRILHEFEISPAIVAQANSSLVCHQDNRNIQMIGRRDDFCRRWDQNNVLDTAKISGVLDNSAVTIQKQGWSARLWPRENLAPDPLGVERMLG